METRFKAHFRTTENFKAQFENDESFTAKFGEVYKVNTGNYNDLFNKPSINEVELSESLISLAYELELYMLILLLERRIVGRRCPVDNINAPLLKLVTDGLKDFPVALYLGEDKIGDLVALHLVLLAARK